MIVYSEQKKQFIDDVQANVIHQKILDEYNIKFGKRVGDSEVSSWRNSMQYMRNVLDDAAIPNDSRVSIEFNIPLTNKRIDFILTGKNADQADTAVIIELKQWSDIKPTNKDAVVKTFMGGGEVETSHPSYQAWTYAALIEDFNQTVRDESITLKPCAYLHNMDSREAINDARYQTHIDKAPVFISADAKKLSEFLSAHVRYGDTDNILYRIEHGRIKPSKNLADCLVSMMQGNDEFLMIDDQKLVYETALHLAHKSLRDVDANKPVDKQVLVVEGGPGTGKSVVAINLLVELTNREMTAQYVSKNAAPRAVYESKLTGTLTKTRISNLFKGSASYTGIDENVFDVLVIDEAHRLMAKNRYRKDSENQIKELIYASNLAIFFIDEDQKVTWSDIGSKEEIRHWANQQGAKVTEMALASQFRCNGSDGYLAWVDNALQIRETANQTLNANEYDFRVFDNPAQLKAQIVEKNRIDNKARMVAGYCWDWISDSRKKKNDPNAMDIVIDEYNFKAQWNLSVDGSLWVVSPNSVHEVGCIHTCQGLEVDYIGVIIGPDLVVRNGEIITDGAKRSKMDASIKGYKKLLGENSELAKQRADEIIKNTYRTLMTRGQKGCYVFSVDDETNAYFQSLLEAGTDPTSVFDVEEKYPNLPLRILDEGEIKPFENAVPIYDLAAAAGGFSDFQNVNEFDWVELPEPLVAKPSYFVVRVVGESMNRRIPNGAWCLFRQDLGGSRNGKVVLVQHRDIQDVEMGGGYTVKVYESSKATKDSGEWQHERIVLSPQSSLGGYEDIVLTEGQTADLRVIGEFVAVL